MVSGQLVISGNDKISQMNSVRQALIYSTADRYLGLIFNFGLMIVVSRLLTPGEIGISVTGSAIVGLALAFREFASTSFIVQRANLSREDVRAAFTVILVLSSLVAGALFICAPYIAYAYRDDGLAPYLRVLSVAILTEAAAAPVLALMRREMAFGQVAIVNITTVTSSVATTITLAVMGFSYMSFALAWLVSAVFGSTLALSLHRQFWIFRPLFSHWRDVLAFGSYNGLIVMLARIYDQVPFLVLGRVVSFDAAGLFNRTLNLAQLPDRIFIASSHAVVFSRFSSKARNGGNLKSEYLAAMTYMTVVHWPALCVLAILAHPIVMFLYGDQWLEIVPLVKIVAVAALFSFSFGLNYSVLVAVGAIREAFLRSLIILPASALLLLAAAPLGLRTMALSLLVAIPFQAVVSLLFVRRHIRMSWMELGLSLWKSVAATIGSILGPAAIALAHHPAEIGLAAAAGAAVLSGIGWALAIWQVKHPAIHEIGHAAKFLATRFAMRRQQRPGFVGPPMHRGEN
ncbi:transporter, membrane protein (plasmid) [Sinorhizobium fredii HH103]|uniref:Transporter, membrane protein n=2 Tax=Rhizobium fredii TaxID=380 RepID=G9AGI2_SINF1|nr:transporter, membrane protein [Sinorhizobium fredii HH103]